MILPDPIVYARAVHFAATLAASGAVLFAVFIAEPAFNGADDGAVARTVRSRLAWIAWIGLVLAVASGVAWLILTTASMSGRTVAEALTPDLSWTVLSQTDFGNDWLARFVIACLLGSTFVPLFARRDAKPVWLKTAASILAAAFVGALAWSGHAIGGQRSEGVLHPAADVLHLIAAAAWVGALVPLALLLRTTTDREIEIARIATLRFSTLGIVSVGTLLITGIVNTWYLAGSIPALTGTAYGRLLLVKIALFFGMIGIAAINRLRLTPRLVQNSSLPATRQAQRQLRRNASVEAAAGAAVICIVALLGTLPPGSHANHHPSAGIIPADATFQHIHTEQGMADVMIEPGHVGRARATIRLWNDDLDTLAARSLTLTLTAPTPGSKPATRVAVQDADGAWHVDDVTLSEPGNWTVEVDAVLTSGAKLELDAPIVVEAK